MLASQDEFKLKAVTDMLEQKLVKRNVPLKGLNFGPVTPAAGSTVRQEISLQQGIPIEKAREIVKTIKDSKKKVQASIQGDLVRVSGRIATPCRRSSRCCAATISASTCSSPIIVPTERASMNAAPDRSLFLDGPAGKLEALLEEPEIGSPARPRWSAIRIRSMAAPCTTKWSTASRADCAAPARWCCASTFAAST